MGMLELDIDRFPEARLDPFRHAVSDGRSIKHALVVGRLSSNPFRCERSDNLTMTPSIPTDHVVRHAMHPQYAAWAVICLLLAMHVT
ncbi:MAG: hypothetical protein Q9210_006784 [Variospora velana]